jgi:hypothetical protein
VTIQTNSYTELASGLCYLTNQQWADSSEVIDTVADGAAASHAGHSVHFAGNINTPKAIHLVAPDGKVFDSRVWGLSYWDSASGQSVLLAPLQDSQGVLSGNNRVVYPNAFQGLRADIEYIFTKSGLEQNIIVREQIPTPASVGLTNSQTVRLQVLTEFFAPVAPQIRSQVVKGVQEDSLIQFGAMSIGVGKAFFTQGANQPRQAGPTRVAKHWKKLDGRDFLIEEVPYSAISNSVRSLPPHASIGKPGASGIKRTASLQRLLPKNVANKSKAAPIRMAKTASQEPGFVIDYTIVEGSSDFAFTAGTYLISGFVAASSAQFEAGAILKFDDSPDSVVVSWGPSSAVFNGAPWSPTVFTSMDDDSVGDPIAGSSGSPTTGGGTYFFELGANDGYGGATNITVTDTRFAYAGIAYLDNNLDLSFSFTNCEFVDCGTNIVMDGTNICLDNVLSSHCTCFLGYYYLTLGVPCTVAAENLTVDSCTQFAIPEDDDVGWGSWNGGITNSLLLSCDGSVGYFTLDHTATSGSVAWQTGFLGDHYLPPDSSYINAGNVTADTLGLAVYTTQTNQTMEGTSTVDLGYHYIALAPNGDPSAYTLGYSSSPTGYTNCDATPSGTLAIDTSVFCVGNPAFDASIWTDVTGLLSGNTVNSDSSVTMFTNQIIYSTILTNWNVIVWDGVKTTNAGSAYFFTPTNTGTGTNVFYYTYSNSSPCSTGPYTISISNTFTVVGVASLAPTNTATWVEITNSTPGTRTFLVQTNGTSGHTTLAVYATPTPSLNPTNLPSCWSLNGVQTNVIYVSIAAPAVYQVTCICGTSALTDFLIVTTNTVTTNTPVDAPCGTGPTQLGYWSFNPPALLDFWAGELNANDSAGSHNGTTNGNVLYTNAGYVSNAFLLDGISSSIVFGTNTGNFGTNDFSVDLWMETAATNAQAIIGKRPNYGAGSLWDLWMTSNGTVTVEVCSNTAGVDYANFTSQSVVNDGNFHHVTLTRWRTNISLYLDDNLDTTVSLTGIANILNATNLTAGRASCTPAAGITNFAGILDEIKLCYGDINPWIGTNDHHPRLYYGLQNPPDKWTNGAVMEYWTNGLQVDSTNGATLNYRYFEADGSANLNGSNGAVRFWFNPDWNGGTGPGAPGYLFELGDVYSPGGGWAMETDPAGTALSFVSGSNGVVTTYLTAPIGWWVSNQWHQVVLSYTTNETDLYLDGGLVASGSGLLFEPDLATRLADGFTVGSDHYGSGQARGIFDELTTFNCPKSQADVIAGYANPVILTQPMSVTVNNGSTAYFTVISDGASLATNKWQLNETALTGSDRIIGVNTNYSGLVTNVLTVADVSDGDAGSYTVTVGNSVATLTSAISILNVNDTAQLGWWLFTSNTWGGQQGQLPTTTNGLAATLAWSTNGVKIDTNIAAHLIYRDVETNGSANINCRIGSLVLWFRPDWSSTNAGGVGPGNDGRFIELGTNGTQWWALCLDSRGTNLSFCTETNGSLTTNARAAISWTNNTWHQVAVTYSSSGVTLYADGAKATNGSGVTKWPSRWGRDQGISVGSDLSTGNLQIRGVLADLETYNYVLSDDDIAGNYSAIWTGGTGFTARFPSLYSSNEFAMARVSGWPSASMTVLVNSTNTSSASWVPFNSYPVADLSTGDGLRTVNFYFKGLGGGVSRVSTRVWLDTTPPSLYLTAPGSNTLNRPTLQLQGYANEDLYSLTYDLSNAFGLLTNLDMIVLNRAFDTNQWRLRTNTFQAFDLGLTPGTNTVTLHAMDWAGNKTTTNYVYVLDYSTKTNPPGVQLYWPTNTALISGTNFTWRGAVDDPTATFTAQIVDGSGDTNVVPGIVERNGNFWVENLPLASGTNWLTLTGTDAASNVFVTNIAVVRSSLVLTFSSIPAISWQQKMDVAGSINSSSYSVWVNGVEATNFVDLGGGVLGWTAYNVPVNGNGTALIQAEAIPSTDNGGKGTGGGGGTNSTLSNAGNPTPAARATLLEACPDKQPCIIYTQYHQNTVDGIDGHLSSPYGLDDLNTTIEDWSLGGGTGGYLEANYGAENDGNSISGGGLVPTFNWQLITWDQSGDGSLVIGSSYTNNDYSNVAGTEAYWYPNFIEGFPGTFETEDNSIFSTIPSEYEWWDPGPDTSTSGSNDFQAVNISYVQGGKAVPVQYVVEFTASAEGSPDNFPDSWIDIPPTDINMAGGRLGSDAIYHKVVPSGAPPIACTPGVDGGPGANNVSAYAAAASSSGSPPTPYARAYVYYGAAATPYLVYIKANATALDVVPQPRDQGFCVGQFITFTLNCDTPDPWVSAWPFGPTIWSLGGTFYNSWKMTPGGLGHYPETSYHFIVDNHLLELPFTTAFWVSGGDPAGRDASKPSTYIAFTAQVIHFLNGQGNAVAPIGLFNMFRPVATMSPRTTAPWIDYAEGSLRAGITFQQDVTLPPPGGSMCYIQIVTSSGQTRLYHDTDGTAHLDPTEAGPPFVDYLPGSALIPYNSWQYGGTGNDGNAADQPSVDLDSSYTGVEVNNETFTMTLFYIPPDTETPSDKSFWDGSGIPVPVRNVTWRWGAHATNGNGGTYWLLSRNPNITFIDPPPNSTSTGNDTMVYPEWIGRANWWNYSDPTPP